MATPRRTRATSNPTLLAWGFALTSLLLAGLCATFGLAFNDEYRMTRLREHITGTLTERDFSQSKMLLSDLSAERPLEWLVTGTAERQQRRLRSAAAFELVSLGDQLRAPRVAQFSATLERAKRAMAQTVDDGSTSAGTWERTTDELQEYFDALNRERELNDQRASLSAECQSSYTAFVEQGLRFSRLLGLRFDPPKDCKGILTYSSGAFGGLPVLSRLGDDLSDLHAAREALAAVGGRVAIEGPNAQEEFATELESVRALSVIARNARDDTLRKMAAIEDESAVLATLRQQKKGRIQVLLTEVVISLLGLPANP